MKHRGSYCIPNGSSYGDVFRSTNICEASLTLVFATQPNPSVTYNNATKALPLSHVLSYEVRRTSSTSPLDASTQASLVLPVEYGGPICEHAANVELVGFIRRGSLL